MPAVVAALLRDAAPILSITRVLHPTPRCRQQAAGPARNHHPHRCPGAERHPAGGAVVAVPSLRAIALRASTSPARPASSLVVAVRPSASHPPPALAGPRRQGSQVVWLRTSATSFLLKGAPPARPLRVRRPPPPLSSASLRPFTPAPKAVTAPAEQARASPNLSHQLTYTKQRPPHPQRRSTAAPFRRSALIPSLRSVPAVAPQSLAPASRVSRRRFPSRLRRPGPAGPLPSFGAHYGDQWGSPFRSLSSHPPSTASPA